MIRDHGYEAGFVERAMLGVGFVAWMVVVTYHALSGLLS